MQKNSERSAKTRGAVIQAALAIIARDGAARLTIDAIAKESGISKGGVMHQFPTKDAVLKALLDHRIEFFDEFRKHYIEKHAGKQEQLHLLAQIATMREALANIDSAALGVLAVIAHEPKILHMLQETDAATVKIIKKEADDTDIALLRWVAARGLITTAILGLCPLSEKERNRLFSLISDNTQWPPRDTANAARKGRKTRQRAKE